MKRLLVALQSIVQCSWALLRMDACHLSVLALLRPVPAIWVFNTRKLLAEDPLLDEFSA